MVVEVSQRASFSGKFKLFGEVSGVSQMKVVVRFGAVVDFLIRENVVIKVDEC